MSLKDYLLKQSSDAKDPRLASLFAAQADMLNDLREYTDRQDGDTAASTPSRADDDLDDVQASSTKDREPSADHLRSVRYGAARHRRAVLHEYPELADEDTMRLQIRVDLVLIGFEGNKKKDLLNIPHKTLELWLEHLTSSVRHATVDDPRHATLRDTRQQGPVPPPAEVEYVYQFHVVDVSTRVRDAVEAHMQSYLRDEADEAGARGQQANPGREQRHMHMPSWHMENLLGSLVAALRPKRLETDFDPFYQDEDDIEVVPAAFTLFVLNPPRSWALPPRDEKNKEIFYGYRCGLSASAMAALAADEDVVRRALDAERQEQMQWRIVHGVTDLAFQYNEWNLHPPPRREFNATDREARRGHNRARIEWRDGTDASYQWAENVIADLPSPESADENADEPPPRQQQQQWSISHEKALLLQGNPDAPPEGRARSLLRDVLEEHRRGRMNEGGDVSGSGSSCLTESWVSGERFAWVDLQAGPFEWGPTAGGEGFKSASLALFPRPAVSSPPPADSSSREGVKEEIVTEHVNTLRGKITARMSRLEVLEMQMGCGKEAAGGSVGGFGVDGDVRRGRGDRRLGVAAVACQEVSEQLAFLRQFTAREQKALVAAGVRAARADSLDGGGGVAIDADILPAMEETHVPLLELVLHALAPATGSDSRLRAGWGWPRLGVESEALLARLAALVSSLARGVITPASALPLPLPPLETHDATVRAMAHSRETGSTSSPNLGSGASPDGSAERSSSPYRLPTGPALTQARGFRAAAAAATSRERGSQTATGTAHPLLSAPPPSALEFFIPDNLAFTLYVVRAQDVYAPLGAPPTQDYSDIDMAEAGGGRRGRGKEAGDRDVDAREGSSGFDLPSFQDGAMSLRLPNQRASFTVHQIAASEDTVLAAALAGAIRKSSVDVVTAEGELLVDTRVSIDSSRIHHQLRARADEDGVNDNKQNTGAAEEARRYTRHVTIFLFSLAGPESVYVDERWRARAVGGDMVVVAQSESRRDPMSPLTCGGRAVEEDPRNPLRQALAALGSIVGGLGPAQNSWDETRGGGVTHDWRWAMSESPMSPLVPHARFSKLDQDIIYRTHVVRALSASAQITRAGASLLREALVREGGREALEGPSKDQLKKAIRLLRDSSTRRTSILMDVDTMSFDAAVVRLNPLLDTSRSAYYLAANLSSTARHGTQAGAASTATAQDPSVLRLCVAVTAAALALWLLVRTVLLSSSTPGSRHRKRVKVN